MQRLLRLTVILQIFVSVQGFTSVCTRRTQSTQASQLFMQECSKGAEENTQLDSRRAMLMKSATTAVLAFSSFVSPALAAERPPLDDVLYRILRVREATQQETRLIKNGTFKDVQRANVKLAVKFMLDNYRLNDAFVIASNYVEGSSAKRVEAGQVGQRAVQNLLTILEYFDTADVQNIKVGQSSMAGKEAIVLKGLDATKSSIDEFLAYFPKSTVDEVLAKIAEENELNVKEFDAELGNIVNMPMTK